MERQAAPGDQPGELLAVLVDWAASQIGVPLGLVDHDLKPEHRDVVADLRAHSEQQGPGLLVGVAVHRALHQVDDHD